ncbi:hypothetical protein LINPERHAP1_LOCUS15504 [Linum perenne]
MFTERVIMQQIFLLI